MPQTLADAFSLLGGSGYDLGILLVVLPLSFLLGAVFFSHVNYQISWTTYFATINIIHIAVLGTKLQWHYMLSFVSGSHQFIVGVLISLQLCALGVLKAAAATGRSNNAYGHSGYSWFALLPLFDLILIFSKARFPPKGRLPCVHN